MKAGDLLFVYGTLRPGAGNMSLDKDRRAKHIATDQITGFLYNMGYYPGARVEASLFDPGSPHIVGDVFELLDQSIIPHLDAYEGYPNLYNRIQTKTADERVVWVYTYNHAVMDEQRIPSGNWFDRPRRTPILRVNRETNNAVA